MSDTKSSVLARKISATGPKPDAFPNLPRFASAIAKAAEATISELLGAEFKAQANGRILPLRDYLADKPDPGFYYWGTDDQNAPTVLFDIAPVFAGAVTARLLGGDLDLSADGAKASALDFGMAESLVDILMPALRALTTKLAPGVPASAFAAKRGVRVKKQVLKEREAMSVYSITVNLSTDGADAPGALTLSFPAVFLEAAGLMRRARSGPALVKKSEAWADLLRQNILKTEIELPVVLDRVMTNVGELSRLQVGQIIDLHPSALHNLDISATTDAGPVSVARGRLGSYHAYKAVKLTTPIDRDFLRGL
jgi:flagellar motor switch protein FliM